MTVCEHRTRGVVLILLMAIDIHGLRAAQDVDLTLSLQEAERMATMDDPGIARFNAKADALGQRAVAEGQLPDPKIRLGMLNFPTDTFNRSQEPMTQMLLGVQQAFPRGQSLSVKTRRTRALSSAQREQAENQKLVALREVRLSWFELYYWLGAERVVKQNQDFFAQLVEVTQLHYAVGRHNQQDVIRAQLELNLLDDRLERIRTQQDKSRAELARWIGFEQATRALSDAFPNLPEPVDHQEMAASLAEHPLIRTNQAQVKASQEGVALAREAYKPSWMLGINYGIRDGENPDGSDRADFFTALVTVDVPLFRNKRQDRQLAASQYELESARFARDERLLELKRMLDTRYAEWKRLGERLERYQHTLLNQANENAQSSLLAYQNDVADFTALMRARITELDTQLKALRIRVDRAKAQSNLLYLAGAML